MGDLDRNHRDIYTRRFAPGPYYHYTSDAGFLGMVKYQQLWFTDIRFLNDSEEYEYGLSVLDEVLNQYDEAVTGYSPRALAKDILIYTLSLSTKSDLLSQWRGYCPDGGYCLALDGQQLNEMVERDRLLVGPCIYDRDAQIKFLQDAFPYSPEAIIKMREVKAPSVWMRKEMPQALVYCMSRLPFIKHPSFAEEAEWRAVKTMQMPSADKPDPAQSLHIVKSLEFRVGRNSLIPYHQVPLLETVQPAGADPTAPTQGLKLHEVIVSPRPHQELSVIAAKLAVTKYGCCEADAVRGSETPFRP